MPYIKQGDRKDLEKLIQEVPTFDNPGTLNYFITNVLMMQYPERYADFNNLVGVLECVKLEFYRRAVAAYEDEKIKENGDVY